MPLVILKGHRRGPFRRAGYTFARREPVEVAQVDLPELEDDLGTALAFCVLDEKGRPRIVESLEEATSPVKTGDDELELPPLEELDVDELRQLAEQGELTISPEATKEQLIEAIREASRPLEELTVKQLWEIAADAKVDLGNARKKAEIVAALQAAGVK